MHGASATGTLMPGHSNLHKASEPILNFGTVTCATEVKVLLEQCALIAVNNNCTAESLANVLFNISNKGKIFKHIHSCND